MKRLLLLNFILVFVLLQQAMAQGRTVTGTVTDAATGEGLPGVAVLVQGTTVGTTTGADGAYTINVPEGSNTLSFRFIGYTTVTRNIDNASTIDVTMNVDTRQLEEVVVTAIGIEREQKALGYSVQQVGAEQIEKSTTPNLVNALNGKVAGVNIISASGAPGAPAKINIRGNTSIIGSNTPLFVIDGVPIDNSSSFTGNPDNGANNNLLGGVAVSNRAVDINPDDVESVSVLKGPAATALYGIRAGNGAIVITTKKGQKGKAVINYSTSYTLDRVNQLPELQRRYGQGSGGEFTGTFPGFNSVLSWGPLLDTMRFDGQPYLYDVNGFLVSQNDPTATEKRAIAYDNLDNFFETGHTWNNTLNLSGGTDKADYYVSLSHSTQNGVVPKSEFDRTSIRITGSTQLSEKLSTFGSANYIKSGGKRLQQGSNVSGVMLGLLRAPISFDLTNGIDDDPADNPASYVLPDGRQRTYREGAGYDNPFWSINRNPFEDDVNRLIGYIGGEYKFTDWFSSTLRVGTDFYNDRRTGGLDIFSRAAPAGQTFEEQIFNRDFNTDLLLTFNRDFSEDLNTRLILGHNYFLSRFQRLFSQGSTLANPTFFDLSNAASIIARENQRDIERVAAYADATISYKETYFLNLTGRNEWSSTLPSSDNSFFYPAVSFGFVFTEPLGLADGTTLPFGKFRISYAVAGNDAPAYSLTTPYVRPAWGDGWTAGISFPFRGVPGYAIATQLGNPDLKAEKNKSFETGLDLRFFENRLGLDFTYYRNVSEDQIIPVAFSATSGFLTKVLNAGEIENKGVEVVLRGTPVQTDNFNWDAIVNFTRNRSEVVELIEGVESITLNGFTRPTSRAVVGEPYGVLYGGKWARNEQGQILIGEDGFPFPADEEGIIGDPNPDWTAGITNTLSYKGINLSFLFDIRKGGDIWNGTEGIMRFFGTSKATENRGELFVFEGVKEDGTPNTQQVVLDESWYTGQGGGFGVVDEQFVEEASWVRLRELTLGYNLPSGWLEGSPISAVNVAFTGRNLWLDTDYSGIDPETNLTGASNGFGLEYFNMPNTRSYGLSLRVTF
ncbi:SusC/RagA family TonB-linked outer membrane protein [Pontibacter ruber]|uniref:SusC/RagA family TonB-linked outer membrane protein n=1 Tax=Pontibacter ruber TaxID=1343895 RepID=A0ABW5D0L2_9BACT|nr:SusC/RagA family TonB-linked outer membrane protein [Pontibacter ruber]